MKHMHASIQMQEYVLTWNIHTRTHKRREDAIREFNQISLAYRVIKNAELRRIYDTCGMFIYDTCGMFIYDTCGMFYYMTNVVRFLVQFLCVYTHICVRTNL